MIFFDSTEAVISPESKVAHLGGLVLDTRRYWFIANCWSDGPTRLPEADFVPPQGSSADEQRTT